MGTDSDKEKNNNEINESSNEEDSNINNNDLNKEKSSNNPNLLGHKREKEANIIEKKNKELKIEKAHQSIISERKNNIISLQELSEENKKLKIDIEKRDKRILDLEGKINKALREVDNLNNKEKQRNYEFEQMQEKLKEFLEEKNKKLEEKNEKIEEKSENQEEKNDNIIKLNNEINKEKTIYSYECLTKELYFSIYEGVKTAKFNIELRNNGNISWPGNYTILSTNDELSSIVTDNIKLKPLNPNETFITNILFNNLETLKPGINKICFEFKVYEKNYGENLIISIEILQKKEPQYKPKVSAFRNMYKIDEKTKTDEEILRALEITNDDFDKAFEYLYQF